MVRPFSGPVTSPTWRGAAEQWIVQDVSQRGMSITGALTPVRARAWSNDTKPRTLSASGP
ncbi:hypothetical protein [Microbacterium pumilum]|uniref:hypothetical protein n=1 Tax=Microbacterium pumilum TaxID=344165 RepID=UPI0031D05CEC